METAARAWDRVVGGHVDEGHHVEELLDDFQEQGQDGGDGGLGSC